MKISLGKYRDLKDIIFQQSQPNTEILGTQDQPHDAGRNGPLCPQTLIATQDVASAISIIQIQTSIEILVEQMIPVGVRLKDDYEEEAEFLTAPLIPQMHNEGDEMVDVIAQQIINGLNIFFGTEIDDTTTVGELLEELLDISLLVDEDCLHLAVYTPYDPYTAIAIDTPQLPIMFFVHGGAFQQGTQLVFDAARLGEVADVIVVSINYRLGPLGFLCLDTDEGAGNMGLLDMVLALEWVQDNIHLFGGDRDRITVFGQSAGAASIGHLMMSSSSEVSRLIKWS